MAYNHDKERIDLPVESCYYGTEINYMQSQYDALIINNQVLTLHRK